MREQDSAEWAQDKWALAKPIPEANPASAHGDEEEDVRLEMKYQLHIIVKVGESEQKGEDT